MTSDCRRRPEIISMALIARRLPRRRRFKRPREVDLRRVLQGILYILSTGCRWRALRGVSAVLDGPGLFLARHPEGGKKSSQRWFCEPVANWDANPGQGSRLSTVKVPRKPRPEAREATKLANASTGASGTSLPTPLAFCSLLRSSCQLSGLSWRRPKVEATAALVPQAAPCGCRSHLPRQSARNYVCHCGP